jgi:hypothetical protein
MEQRMKTLSRTLLAALTVVLLAACSPAATPNAPASTGNNPYAAQPGDGAMMRGELRIDSASLNLAESQPVQVMLNLAYFQPTPCFSLRVETSQPDAQNRINVSAYAVAEKDKPCALMALSTPLHASLNLGSFPKGHYGVWLNGAKVGEFDA